jgi:tRNA(adenine34) deaminase
MRLALAQAQAAAQAGEVPVGAVVVRQGQLVATGRNAPIAGHDPTAHAEIVALRAAAQALGNYRLDDCTLYVTLEPCAMCSGALLHARVAAVVYGASDPKTGAAGSALQVLQHPALNHRTQVRSGVLAEACGALLRQFFAPRRVNLHPLRDDALRTPERCFEGLQAPDSHDWTDLPSLRGWRLHGVDAPPLHKPQHPAQADWTLLCLHSSTAWSWAYRHLWPVAQAAGARVLVPDLIGFGRSDKPKKRAVHTPAWHAEVLAQWLQHVQAERITLLYPESPSLDKIALELVLLLENQHRPVQTVCAVTITTTATTATARQPKALPLAAWCEAPFPDAGHRAGPQAWAAWAKSDATWDERWPKHLPRQRLCISDSLWAALNGQGTADVSKKHDLLPLPLPDWESVIAQVQQSTLLGVPRSEY